MAKAHELEKHKQAFLAVIKWCSRQSGARIVFDSEDSCPKADVENNIIHMPKRIPLNRVDGVLGIVVHEAMHIKHTPKWLSDLCRDDVDKLIFNALEDGRIETIACNQLKALVWFLRKNIKDLSQDIDESKVDLPLEVLGNIACRAAGVRLFTNQAVQASEAQNKPMLDALKDVYRRVFSVTTGKSFEANVTDLFIEVDKFRKVYKFPDPDPDQSKKSKQPQATDVRAECGIGGDASGKLFHAKGSLRQGHHEESLDTSDINAYLIDMNEQAKSRIKETLKKSMEVFIDEGMMLNTDNLTAIMTGDVDELFHDTKSEKKTRTKLYFLMDVSGSMSTAMPMFKINGMEDNEKEKSRSKEPARIDTAISAFKAIAEVMEEVKSVHGVDLEYDNYLFGDDCVKIKSMADIRDHDVGGGTELIEACKKVLSDVQKDDPANKRIVVILTDGEVGDHELNRVEKLIQTEAQDIRIVLVGIGNAEQSNPKLFRHNIISPEHAEAKIIESFEEAL